MAEQLENILNLMGEKFDASFEVEQEPKRTDSLEAVNIQSSPEKRELLQESHDKEIDRMQEQVSEKQKQTQQQHLQNAIQYVSNLDSPHFKPTSHLKIMKAGLQVEGELSKHQKEELDKPLDLEGDTGQHFQSQPQFYRSLTERFQQALSKIHSQKTVTGKSNQFMERMQHYQHKKNLDLQILRRERQQRQSAKNKGKPLINSKSMQIISNHTPIQLRYKEVIENKKSKIEKQIKEKEEKERIKIEQELKEMEQYEETLREKIGKIRSQEEFYTEQVEWNQKRLQHIEELTKKKQDKIKQQTSFKPIINKNSSMLMKKKPNRVPIYDQEPEFKQAQLDEHCTFTPRINRRK